MNLSTEPTRLVGYLTALVTAIIGLAVAFGANISDEQRNALLGAMGAAVPIVVIGVELIRSKVVSPQSAGEAVGIAKSLGPETNVIPVIEGISGFKTAAADAAGKDPNTVSWRPPVEAHG